MYRTDYINRYTKASESFMILIGLPVTILPNNIKCIKGVSYVLIPNLHHGYRDSGHHPTDLICLTREALMYPAQDKG